MKDDGITKLIDGDIYYHYHYADYLYQELNKRDKEIERLKEENKKLQKEVEKLQRENNVLRSLVSNNEEFYFSVR